MGQVLRLFVAQLETVRSWMRDTPDKFLNQIQPYDRYLIFSTGDPPMVQGIKDKYLRMLKQVEDQAELLILENTPKETWAKQVAERIKPVLCEDCHVFFLWAQINQPEWYPDLFKLIPDLDSGHIEVHDSYRVRYYPKETRKPTLPSKDDTQKIEAAKANSDRKAETSNNDPSDRQEEETPSAQDQEEPVQKETSPESHQEEPAQEETPPASDPAPEKDSVIVDVSQKRDDDDSEQGDKIPQQDDDSSEEGQGLENAASDKSTSMSIQPIASKKPERSSKRRKTSQRQKPEAETKPAKKKDPENKEESPQKTAEEQTYEANNKETMVSSGAAAGEPEGQAVTSETEESCLQRSDDQEMEESEGIENGEESVEREDPTVPDPEAEISDTSKAETIAEKGAECRRRNATKDLPAQEKPGKKRSLGFRIRQKLASFLMPDAMLNQEETVAPSQQEVTKKAPSAHSPKHAASEKPPTFAESVGVSKSETQKDSDSQENKPKPPQAKPKKENPPWLEAAEEIFGPLQNNRGDLEYSADENLRAGLVAEFEDDVVAQMKRLFSALAAESHEVCIAVLLEAEISDSMEQFQRNSMLPKEQVTESSFSWLQKKAKEYVGMSNALFSGSITHD